MEFKELEIKSDESWFKRKIWTVHGKKTFLYITVGALIGLLFYLLSDDTQFSNLDWNDLLQNVGTGAFFGFLITNSPCARNKC